MRWLGTLGRCPRLGVDLAPLALLEAPRACHHNNRMFDVAIVGGGPAGASCAAFCAAAGLRTAIFAREKFPREEVCGDCINPACWTILRRLKVAERIRDLPHGKLSQVDFIGINGQRVSVALPAD